MQNILTITCATFSIVFGIGQGFVQSSLSCFVALLSQKGGSGKNFGLFQSISGLFFLLILLDIEMTYRFIIILLFAIGALMLENPDQEKEEIKIIQKPSKGNILRNLSDLSSFIPAILTFALSTEMIAQGF